MKELKLLAYLIGHLKMTSNPSLMEESFHDWLDNCPNSWVRIQADNESSTYKFYRNTESDD